MRASPLVLIAGAGLGGLTAALSLLKKGIDVEVYEQAPEIAEFGAGIQVSANASRVLYELGLGDELERIGTRLLGRETRLWNTGQSWPQITFGASAVKRHGFPHYVVHRADLQAMLVAAVRREKADVIRVKARCVEFRQSDGGVTLRLDDGRQVSGDTLIGADGIHSVIRERLFGEDKPWFTGCMAWRGLAPAAWLPERLLKPVGMHWISRNAHIFHYPVRKGQLLNMIGVLERDDWRIESWSARGTIEECAADFTGWHPDIHEIIRNFEVPYKWALMSRKPLQRWSVGRVSLLGDACHPPLPYLAQGAAMAIEDAFVLARSIERRPEDLSAALKVYEAARVERTTRMVRETVENLKRMHDESLADPASAERHVNKEFEENLVRERTEWLYGYDAVHVPLPEV